MSNEAGGTNERDIQACNFIIACYVVSLVQGETILSRKIRHATLKGYVMQALAYHTDRNLPLPLPRSAKINYIKIIMEAVRKYELVPNQREMIHDVMFKHMIILYDKHRMHVPDSLVIVLCEWMFLGRYVGFRSGKWCHNNHTNYTQIDDPEWGDRPNAIALIQQDICSMTVIAQRSISRHTGRHPSLNTTTYC